MRLAVLVLLHFSIDVSAICPCNGVVLSLPDQQHCWEVLPRPAPTWVDADVTCQSVGGHLGHPDDSIINSLYKHIIENYTKPVLTGIVAGSAEAGLYAMICPNNVFYGLFPENKTLSENMSGMGTCVYITDESDRLTLGSCTLDSNVLCDRPSEKNDYCNIKMSCPESTTSISVRDGGGAITAFTNDDTTTAKHPLLSTTTVSSNMITTRSRTSSMTKRKECTELGKAAGCGSNQWVIFGWCVDWRFLLLFTIFFSGLFLLLCILHFCCKLCVSPCQLHESKKRKNGKVGDACMTIAQPVSKDLEEPPAELNRYETENPSAVLPPPTTATQPVFIPLPMREKRESLISLQREIRFVPIPKPETVDIGVNTSPLLSVRKRKAKKADKLQVRQPRPFHSPLVEVDGDIDDDVSIKMERSDSNDTILPKGDTVPNVFTRNANPPQLSNSSGTQWNDATIPFRYNKKEMLNVENVAPKATAPFGGRKIRSPPPLETSAVQNERPMRNVLSPKDRTSKGDYGEFNSSPETPDNNSGSLQESPFRRNRRQSDAPIFMEPRIQTGDSMKEPTIVGTKALMGDSVSMKNPHGRMGGAVRSGGGGGDVPVGWKPWAKGSPPSPPQFLNED